MIELRGWWIPRADEPHPVEEQLDECRGQIARAVAQCPVDRRRTVVQAGGRVGLWPLALAGHFKRVITFEPDSENWACCFRNLASRAPNVEVWDAALGDSVRKAPLTLSRESTGKHFLTPGEPTTDGYTVNVVTLDSFHFQDLDALFLDVEGAELLVLQGAIDTINRCRPVIVLEENELCFRYGRERGACQRFLEILGYQLVDEWTTLPPELQQDGFRGSDLIFAPR